MNTMEVREHLNAKDENGEFKIPFLVICDAFQSEMVAFADLVLPDTTYLERHDAMSMLDRPISEFDGPCDSVRIPVLPPTGQCKPFQEVLIELASRLKFPAFTTADGQRKFKDYPDFITNFQTAPDSGIGFLMGWRGKEGDKSIRGEPNSNQWQMYETITVCFITACHPNITTCAIGIKAISILRRLTLYVRRTILLSWRCTRIFCNSFV
jgi:anaerobic selenocysteine-containing dehydrogenase